VAIHPVTTDKPTYIHPRCLYALSYFVQASGLSTTRLQFAKRDGVELKTIACGRRKFVFGADGIDFVRRLSEHYAQKK
jgi:hypothetical protein